MKKVLILFLAIAIGAISCKNKENSEQVAGLHKVVVKEVLQANAYTYLHVTEDGKEQWLAVTKMDAQEGDTYYFKEFMEMKYFESNDLNRAFESIYFIQDLKSNPEDFNQTGMAKLPEGHAPVGGHEGKPKLEKEKIEIEPADGGLTVAELYKNKNKYEGERVLIKGKVIKVNPAIMEKDWVHIQDGTSENGKFDLTITTENTTVKVGDIVTFEGKVTLDKDFGYGYKYDLLLEEAVVK